MNEKQFYDPTESVFLRVETWLENTNTDIDFENQEGILTLVLPDKSQLILSRQTAMQEIWLASPQGAYHFQYLENNWKTRQGDMLWQVIVDVVKKQAGIVLDTDLLP